MSKFDPFPHIIYCPECHQKRNHTEMTEAEICNHCYYRNTDSQKEKMKLRDVKLVEIDPMREKELEKSK